jgi:hypothetical protein
LHFGWLFRKFPFIKILNKIGQFKKKNTHHNKSIVKVSRLARSIFISS